MAKKESQVQHMRASVQRVIACLIGALYFAALRFDYIEYISPLYSYAGLVVVDHSPWLSWLGFAVTMMTCAGISWNRPKPSTWCTATLLATVAIPAAALWPLMSDQDERLLAGGICCLGLSTMMLQGVATRTKLGMGRPTSGRLAIAYFPVALWVVELAGIALLQHLAHRSWSLDWDSQYDRRMEARQLVGDGPIAYVVATLQKAVLPLSYIIGFLYNRYVLLCASFALSLAFFSFEGSKSSLFLGLILGICVVTVRYAKDLGVMCYFALYPVITGLAALLGSSFGYHELEIYFVRRMLVIPCFLTRVYAEAFMDTGARYFAGSQLGIFFGTSDDYSSARHIGSYYLNAEGMNANANLWASGLLELGPIGLLMACVLASVTLGFLDTCNSESPDELRVLVGIYCGLIWSQQAFQTSLLSSGLLFLLAIVYLGINTGDSARKRS